MEYDVIYADPCMKRMTPEFDGIFVDTIHFAVSGHLAEMRSAVRIRQRPHKANKFSTCSLFCIYTKIVYTRKQNHIISHKNNTQIKTYL